MKLWEIKEKIKRVEEELGNVNFDPYVVNVWEDITKLQGILTPETKEEIERAGFRLVGSFIGDDGTVYYHWRKRDIEVTLHTR